MALTRPSFTQLTTTTTAFNDPITVLNQGSASANVDVGFLFNRANGLVSNVALYWSEATQSFVTAYTTATGTTNANVTPTSFANIRTGNITANGFFWSNGTVFSSGSTFTGGYVQNTIIAAANLVANSGTASSSNVTGAVVVSGGIGVSGSVNIGSNLVFSNGTNPGISKPLGVRVDINNAGGLDSNGPFWSGYHFNAPDGIVVNGLTGYPRMAFYWNYNSVTNPNNINFNMVAGNNATGGNANVSLGTDTAGYVRFLTNNAERLKIGGEGNVVVTATTASSSTTTGALVVAGGAGIAGNLNVGGVFNTFSGNIGIGTTTQSGYKLDVSQSTNDTTIRSITTGAGAWLMTYDSTAYYSGVKHVGNNGARYWTTGMTNNSQTYTIAMDATGTTNRFFTIDTTGNIVISATTTSTSTTTGALVVKGGVGIAGQMSVASNITLSESGGSGTRTVLSSSGSGAIINHNDNSDVFLQTQGNTRIQILNTSGIVSFPYGITANSSGIRSTFANIITTNGVYWANGAAYSSGGSFTGGYVASQSTFGANLVANSGTASSSTTTGALVVAGGVGIAGALYVGGATQAAAITSSGTIIASTINAGTFGNASATHVGASATLTGTLIATTVNAGTIGNSGATLTGTLSTAAQTNITSVGTLTSLAVGAVTSSGTIIASTINAGTIGNSGATLTGTVSTAAQNSITTMTGLTGFGTASVVTTAAGHLTVTGNLTVNGTQNIINNTIYETTEYVVNQNATNGNIGTLVATTGFSAANAVITGGSINNVTVGATTHTTGRFTTVTATTVNAGTIGNSGATLTGTLNTAAQTGITSVGTLTGLTVTGTTALAGTTASTLNATSGNTTTGYFGSLNTANAVITGGYINSLANLTATTAHATNFSSGNIYFTGTTAGTVSTANVALYTSTTALTTNQSFYPQFANLATTGNTITGVSANWVFNPSTGNLVLAGTTTSSSTTTGALVVAGGAGIAGNINIGGTTNYFAGIVMVGTPSSSNDYRVDIAPQSSGAALRLRGGSGGTSYLQFTDSAISTQWGFLETSSGSHNISHNQIVRISTASTERVRITAAGNVVINGTTASTSTTTGALVIAGGAGIAGNLYVGGSFFQGNLPSVLNDISPQFDSAKTVFALTLDQTSISSITNSADVEVVINGRRLVPYVTEQRFPWLTPYDSYRGYRVSSGNLIIYNAPDIGDQAMVTIVSTSAAVQTRRYPYSATTIAFGD